MPVQGDIEHTTNLLLKKFNAKAVVFDLDGTLIDNNPYHLQAFLAYLKSLNRQLSLEEYRQHINGRTNNDAFRYLFGDALSADEITTHTNEKEAVYRAIYKQHINPVAGLIPFLETLKAMNIPMAIATSGIQPNIDFFFEHVPVKDFFTTVINSTHITQGKPHPEIYLKAANALHVETANCLAFEDAVVGVASAKAAGMQVIGILTTEPASALQAADALITNFLFENFTELFS